tara:strand:- start:119 stop:568 length:450 start_codon:yes stop_codon:yes gene_type:complete
MIQGVKITKKKQFLDERGKIMHMLRYDDKIFKKFGEIYFSCTFPKAIKAWHLHKKMTLNYVIVHGRIKLVLYDSRKKSKTYGKIQEIFLSTEDYNLITIPPLIWNGFKAIGNQMSIIANCSDIPHDPKEILRKAYDTKEIPYKWGMRFK